MTRFLRTSLAAFLACLCVLASIAPPAADASGRDVLADCSDDGALDRSHSSGDLRDALDGMPSDLEEYSDCAEVISAALERVAGRGASASGRRLTVEDGSSVRGADPHSQRRMLAGDGATASGVPFGRRTPPFAAIPAPVESEGFLPAWAWWAFVSAGLLALAGAAAVLVRRRRAH